MKDYDLRSFLAVERERLVRYVRSLLREAAEMDAEDVVHDVVIKLLERPETATPLDEWGAYVLRALRNRVIDRRRLKRPSVSLEAEAESGVRFVDLLRDLGATPVEMLQTAEGRAALFAALEALNEMERKVIIAHEFEGLTFADLSARWQIPQNTLLSHKARGIKKLSKLLKGV